MKIPTWPSPSREEIEAVAEVLMSGRINYWTGEEGKSFEREFAAAVDCKYGVALTNGSVALEAALVACGVGAGDEVVVTPRSFVASASSVVRVGARPVFADVDEDSQNLTRASIEKVLTPRSKAIVAVHIAGWPCEMRSIVELACAHGLRVIEDCAQAHGASYEGQAAGSLADCAAWSFCQDKIMTTGGEGGMVTTNDSEIWERVWSLKDHGRDHTSVFHRNHPPGFRWYIESFGTNWRMTEMQAAIGRVQLGKLDHWVACRRRNAAILEQRFLRIPALRVTVPPPHFRHSYYKYYTFVRPERLKRGWDRDRIMEEINRRGFTASVGVCPEIYREKAFVEAGLVPGACLPVASVLGENSLMFEVHPTLEPVHLQSLADTVEEIVAEATA